MKINKGLILISALFLVFVGVNIAVSNDESNIIRGPSMQPVIPDPEMQWVWGEVLVADPVSNKIILKYLDYETENEKDMNISVNELTTYDNLSSLTQLKPTDTISVDYVVTPEGVNLAKNISIEKSEEISPALTEPATAPVEPQAAMPNPEGPAMQEMMPPPTEEMPNKEPAAEQKP
ncbi:MAG: hypothetical protein MUC39_02765 [Candidatus Omnitrophica bacterium]|jgi:hypothetical protein|nr:hypothetical protein [Candidatus Omnitrophota bacterium]